MPLATTITKAYLSNGEARRCVFGPVGANITRGDIVTGELVKHREQRLEPRVAPLHLHVLLRRGSTALEYDEQCCKQGRKNCATKSSEPARQCDRSSTVAGSGVWDSEVADFA